MIIVLAGDAVDVAVRDALGSPLGAVHLQRRESNARRCNAAPAVGPDPSDRRRLLLGGA